MVISIGAAAFWVALAAVLISGGYFQFRRERLRQETLLRIVEKTGQLDEQQVKALFPPPPAPPPHVWGPPEHADGRRGLKVGGTIVFSLGAGMAIFSASARLPRSSCGGKRACASSCITSAAARAWATISHNKYF